MMMLSTFIAHDSINLEEEEEEDFDVHFYSAWFS